MTEVTIDERIAQYVKLRDLIKSKDDTHKEHMKPFRETLEKLGNVLLDRLNQIGVDSANSPSGTVYKTTRNSASLSDPDAFMKFVIENNAFDLMDRKANSTAVAEFIEAHGAQPPGVKYTSTHIVGVRRS